MSLAGAGESTKAIVMDDPSGSSARDDDDDDDEGVTGKEREKGKKNGNLALL